MSSHQARVIDVPRTPTGLRAAAPPALARTQGNEQVRAQLAVMVGARFCALIGFVSIGQAEGQSVFLAGWARWLLPFEMAARVGGSAHFGRAAALPRSAQPGAKAALAAIFNAEDRRHARDAVKAFAAAYGAKWPKAVAKITDHVDVLLEFYNYPAEHWVHVRTTNPIESTFATVRLRQRVTKGPGSRAARVAMAFKLIESAQQRWRAINTPHLVALVRAGARLHNGKLVERPEEEGAAQQAG